MEAALDERVQAIQQTCETLRRIHDTLDPPHAKGWTGPDRMLQSLGTRRYVSVKLMVPTGNILPARLAYVHQRSGIYPYSFAVPTDGSITH